MDIFGWIDKGGIYTLGVIVMGIIAWLVHLDGKVSDQDDALSEQKDALRATDKTLAVVAAGVETLVETENEHSRKLDSLLASVSELNGAFYARNRDENPRGR